MQHCIAGASVWKFASVDGGVNPDVYGLPPFYPFLFTKVAFSCSVLVGIGVEVTFEVIAAAALLRTCAPDLRVRVINVTDLFILADTGLHPHSLSADAFKVLFTEDKPIVVNYHGYPMEVKGLLFGRPNLGRVVVGGYQEEGTTTSPFDVCFSCISGFLSCLTRLR